ncbi:MAG TPA: lipopolysaccharide heptosyltransferase II [Acidobacteriota bacterium]|nr:lipopolysaccharide heptosyltransferase II [Acidobacteriota bacterium]
MTAAETLIVRTTNWLGDTVMALPALRELRRLRPAARLVVAARAGVAGFYRWAPEVDEVITLPPEAGRTRRRAFLGGCREIRRRRPSLYVCLPNSFESALMGRVAGVPERVGYRTEGRGFLLTHGAAVPTELHRRHQVYYYLHLLHAVGLSPVDYLRDPEFKPDLRLRRTPAMEAVSRRFFEAEGIGADGPVMGVHAGAFYGSAKRWFPERFAAFIRELRSDLPLTVVLFGSPAEQPLADAIAAAVGGGRLHNLCGRTTLDELVPLIGSCHLFVSNDSGPMHVAAAFQIPQLALFGSTDPVATGPFSPRAVVVKKPVECSPCFLRECPLDLRCFKAITVDEVVRRGRELIYREYSSDK